ncbi:hypothetical protein [Frankia tisae]|uniref:hypothetical protein n=1 Tax=Frankia tisae TaxID=2950104 RepID=UPI0021C105C7|nr:hypothetical protein [Frankia tisae]
MYRPVALWAMIASSSKLVPQRGDDVSEEHRIELAHLGDPGDLGVVADVGDVVDRLFVELPSRVVSVVGQHIGV